MPGSPILAAHIAEIQRKKKEKEDAAKKSNAKTATQKASSQNVTDIVNKGIKDAGGVAGSTLSSIKKPSGILSVANTNHSSVATGSAILAKRIAERKALSEQHKRQVQSAAQRHDGMTTTEFANKNNAPTVQSPYKTTGGSFTNQEREDLIAYLSTLPEDQKNQYVKSIVATDGLTDQSYNLITNTISSMSSDQQVELAKIVMNSPGSSIYNPSKKAQDIFKMLSPEVQANVIKSTQESIQQSAEENNSTGKMLVAESQKIAADRMDKIKEERASKNGVAKFWDDLNLYLDAAWTGAAGVDSGIIGFIQMLNENVGNEDGPVLDYLKSWQDKYKNKINEQNLVAEATDKSTAVDISRAVGRLAMDVPFTFFGGGTTAAAKEAPAMIKAIKALGAPFQNAATAERAITYAGTRYDEARSYGASVEKATKASLIYAFPQAYLESLGGVDKVVNTLLRTGMAPKKILSSIATGAISEGIEEGGQQVWESGSKTLYGKDIPMYSNSPGVDAWINPSMIKESAFLGAVLGGFFGGGITVANNGIFKLVKDDDISTLSAIENDIKDNLSSGKINEKSADALMKEINQAKAIYDIVQSKTMVDSKGKTDGYVSDGTLTKDQADSLWRVVSAQAAENGDREIPTYNIGDIIQFDGEDAKVINIVEEDDGKKYFVDVDGQMDVITEDELAKNEQNGYNENIINDEGGVLDGRKSIPGQLGNADGRTADNMDRTEPGYGILQRPGITEANQSRESKGQERPENSGRSARLVNQQVREKMNSKGISNARLSQTSDAGVFSRALTDGTANQNDGRFFDGENNIETAWNDLKEQYGTWKRGQAPQQINDTQIVSKFVDNALANIEDPAIREALKQRVLEGGLTHERYTDNQVRQDLANDRAILSEDAVDAQMEKDAEAVKNINTKKLVTAAIQELVYAVNNGDSSSALYLAQLMADVGTKFGQGSQAFSQLKKLTPTGRVLYAQQQLNADYKKKYGYAPEAIKADIETNTKEEIPNILSESVSTIQGDNVGNIVRQAISDGSLDLSEKIKRGDLKEVSLEITRYIASKQNITGDNAIEINGAIYDEIHRRVIAHRKSVIENMIAKTGKNKRKDYLNTLLEYNNIGAFDDPDVAATVLDKMKLPFLTKEDFNFITETAEKASKLPTDSREQLAEYSKIDKLLNEKKKHTVLQKIRTIQITGMLLSPRTMERNVVPNIAMSAPNAIGDIFGTVLDKQIAKKTGQRTMGNAANPANTLRDMKSGAVNVYKDIKEGVDTSLAGNRDNVPIGDVFSNGNLAGRTMNMASKVVTFGLQFGDRPFEEAYYNNSLRRQMEANGVTEPTQIMRDIAYTTATQRTWKDENRITRGLEAFQKWANAGNDFGFGSILMPFVKTPANLLKALYDYSPAAFASVVYDYRKLNKADPGTDEQVMAQFNLVNHLSKAVGGTIIMATAFALAKAGLIEITGAGDDNQDKEKYKEEVLGWQPYSFKIGDKYYSYAWVQPFASFFGSGADIYANLKKPENQGDNTIDTIINALGEAFTMSGKMIYEQTVLQGVSKLFSQDDPWNGFLEILVSAPQQFVPAMIGQLAATIDPYKRQTYTPPENLGGFVDNAVAGVVNRIPFASMTLPAKTNAMGEKMERFPGGVGSNFLNSFFNPAQVSQEKSNAVTDEIDRLEKATNEKLYPNSADNTVEVGTKTIILTGKEKQAWNKSVGGDFKAAVKELMNSDFYAEMTDDQKAKAISKIHEDINAIYKNEFLNKKDAGIPLESEYQKIKDAKDKYNISTAEFVAVKSGLNQISDDDGEYDAARKRDFVLNFCEGKGYSDEATVYMMDNLVFQNSTSVKNQAESLLVNANIPILDTYKAYSFYEKTISTTDNRTAISGLSTFIAEQAPNLTQEQRKLLGETIVNVIDPYGYFEQIVVKMSGDPETDSTTALSKTMKKLLGQAADLGLTKDEFIYAYSYFKKVDNNASPESFARQIDKLNISADAKILLTKARWVDVGDYAFRDGGEIEIKGYKLGTDIDLSERIDGRTKGGNTMAEYVPPSARESGVPNVVYKKPSNGKYMTVIAGEYKVTEEKIGGVKTGERAVFETEAGSAVVSPLGGKIVSVKRNSYIGGITVTVKYSDGTFGTYDGLADVSVKADDKVKPGQRIGSSSESVTFLYKDKTGTIKTPSTVFNIVDGSGSIESTSDYFPTKTAEIHDNFKAFSSGWGGYGGWGYGGYGGGGSSILSSLIGKKHSSYSRYGYGGWPTFSYTGNENKKS